MRLRKSNWFVRYYIWIFEKEPEVNCGLFWGLIYAIGLFPISIPGRMMRVYFLYDVPIFLDGLIFYTLNVVFYVIGVSVTQQFNWKIAVIYVYIIGIMSFLTAGALLIGVIYGIVWLIIQIEKRSRNTPPQEVEENKVHWFAAIKMKYCSKIEWIESIRGLEGER